MAKPINPGSVTEHGARENGPLGFVLLGAAICAISILSSNVPMRADAELLYFPQHQSGLIGKLFLMFTGRLATSNLRQALGMKLITSSPCAEKTLVDFMSPPICKCFLLNLTEQKATSLPLRLRSRKESVSRGGAVVCRIP